MITKLVYALVSNNNDLYTEQFFLSAVSAKRNKVNHITLVVDDKTDLYLKNNCSKVLEVVDEYIVVPYPDEMTNKVRSRYLKTTIRNIVDGDILFVDTDTLITDSLEDIDLISDPFSAVYDMHVPFVEHGSYHEIKYKAGKIGYQPNDEDEYYNSGVMYIKDTDKTRLFFKEWHTNYVNGLKVGNTTDQQSLLKTNSEYRLITRLNDIWNCQIICNVRDINNAKVIHYYGSRVHDENPIPPYKFMSKEVFTTIRNNGYVLSESINDMLLNAKSAFNTPVKLVSGAELTINSSLQYYLLTQLFKKHRTLFEHVEKIIQFLRKIAC